LSDRAVDPHALDAGGRGQSGEINMRGQVAAARFLERIGELVPAHGL